MRWEVLFYQTTRGESPVEDFLEQLPEKARAKCVAYLKRLEDFGFQLPSSIISKVRGDIWELRPEWGGVEYRFFYVALVGRRIVVLHVIQKQSQKLKGKDIELAERRFAEVLRRVQDETAPPIRPRTD